MTTEPKKLQTTLSDLDLDGLTGDTFSLVHDARIAHEQREVIRQLVRAFGCEAVCPPEHHCEICAAIRAAEPFLEHQPSFDD